MEKILTFSNLTIEFPTKILEINSLNIIEEFNEHGMAKLELLAISEEEYRFIDDITPLTSIKIAIVIDEETNCIFSGIMTKIKAKKIDKVYNVNLELKSKTFLMDIKLKRRSFQNEKLAFKSLFKRVVSSYKKAIVYDNASKGKAQEESIIQYYETDFMFLKRLASKLGTKVICNVRSDNPTLSIGKFQGKRFYEETPSFTLTRENGEFLKAQLNYGNYKEEDKIYYKIKSLRNFEISDTVEYREISFKVYKKETNLEKGIIVFTYWLIKENGLLTPEIINHKILGASIDGKVIDVTIDRVKLHLSIDEKQQVSEAKFYKCETSYTAEGKTGFYSMPQIGDNAKLYIPNEYIEDAYVRVMNRLDGKENIKFKDPSIKYYGNVEKKELMLSKKEFQITSTNGLILINMDETEGVEITSSDDILIKCSEEAKINGKKIGIRAANEILLATKSSSILMNNNINIKAEDEARVIQK